jgi:hypothetical protein
MQRLCYGNGFAAAMAALRQWLRYGNGFATAMAALRRKSSSILA